MKLEPIVLVEVKKFLMKDAFILDLLERAKLMQESKNQIEVLAERIATLPKDFELKPSLDQPSKLQKTRPKLNHSCIS